MINNGMSWLSLGNYINPKARNTELSNDYNQLTNRPIITLTGTSQNPIKLWKLDVGLYILNGYVQHTDALLSEARGLFVSATVGIVNGKYVISAFIPFWEGQYEYILPSLSSEIYTEHQMIRMITQGNSLTLDNIREYFPTQDYHPTTKKYVDETMGAIRNELNKMGLNNNDVQSLIKENRRRDIAIQALLSQNSDKMVTIDEEVHNISMDYSLDNGIATINTLEGDTLVNVSKDIEYDKILSYEQDIVENTNTVDLEVDGSLNPIIVGDTLVNVCTQNNPTAITNEYTVEGNNHFALQDEVEGNCRPIIQGNTIVNRSKTKDSTPLTTYVSEVEGNEMNLVNDTDTHIRIDKLVGDTMVNLATDKIVPQARNFKKIADNTYSVDLDETGYANSNVWLSLKTLQEFKDNTTYTMIFEITENTLTSNETTNWTLIFANYTTGASVGDVYNTKGLIVRKFTTNFNNIAESAKGEKQWQIVITSDITGGKITIKNPMLLEGDYTNKPIPQEYFEGLKNSYEGEYIPSDVWCNYNKSEVDTSNIMSTIISEHSFEYKAKSSFSGNISPANMLDILNLKTEMTYTFIGKVNAQCTINIIYNENISMNKSIIFQPNIPTTFLFKTPQSYNRICIRLISTDTSVRSITFSDIILLEGDYTSNPPTYEEVMEHSGKYRCEVEVQGENYNQTQTVYLNSPLLKGDEVVYKEGKLCHYHKMGKVVLDGSEDENWCGSDSYDTTQPRYWIIHSFGAGEKAKIGSDVTSQQISDKMLIANPYSAEYTKDCCCILADSVRIRKNELVGNLNGFKQWLSENPTTIVYELANPYYETISTSELLLPITTNCKLLTSSNIPLTTMSTRVFTEEVNILANTQYSLNFNSDVASTVNITLGGIVLSNQAIVKGYNKFNITTPSTLVDNNSLLIIEGSGVNISEVVVTEYDEGVCEYIEGLKSSFEDGYIPSEIIVEWENINRTSIINVKPNTTYTLINLNIPKGEYWYGYGVYDSTTTKCILGYQGYYNNDFSNSRTFNSGEFNKVYIFNRLITPNNNFMTNENDIERVPNYDKVLLCEGDWTHLHLTEEDLNHLGQYKVEYKTVGKNKFDGELELGSFDFFNGNETTAVRIRRSKNFIEINGGKTLTLSSSNINTDIQYIFEYDKNKKFIKYSTIYGKVTLSNETKFIRFRSQTDGTNGYVLPTKNPNIQIEEGTVATEYEPYKESIQTVYLNSPLLEGDTIEEIDGEVYHVHRMGEVVLDGSENWKIHSGLSSSGVTIPLYITITNVKKNGRYTFSNNFTTGLVAPESGIDIYMDKEMVTGGNTYNQLFIRILKSKLLTTDENGFKQWLSENPTTIVYELENPTYELIPSSSIICKSYPNGHLDFDTNVHINNTVNFVKANLPITYANVDTIYKLQFVSDKDMENVTINALGNIMENVTITKGLNKISFTSPSDATNILTFEGLGYAYISDVQLVATEKDIDYFKGLYSTYECGLIEDESNENYGKYEVNIVSYNAPIQFGKGGKIE